MIVDYHIHTQFSPDSNIKLDDLICLAKEKKYQEIAITEHLDLLPQEVTTYGLPSLKKYKATIQQFQSVNSNLRLICGIEVGDFHQVKYYAESILTLMNFELVIGSVHFLSDHKNISIPFKPLLTPSEIRDYYEQNLLLVETCNIDILAHLGVYKRYYFQAPDEKHCQSLIEKLFSLMIKKGIALEVNFSSFRKNYKSLLPELKQLVCYKKLGGKLVSVGSDSHRLMHFHDYHHKAMETITELGFEIIKI